MKFKDYEYGWYGFQGSFKGKWMDLGYNQNFVHSSQQRTYNNYWQVKNQIFTKQIPKLKGVAFIYGDYKTCV